MPCGLRRNGHAPSCPWAAETRAKRQTMTAISARSRRPDQGGCVDAAQELVGFLGGDQRRLAAIDDALGPANGGGVNGTSWPVTSQSNRLRIAACQIGNRLSEQPRTGFGTRPPARIGFRQSLGGTVFEPVEGKSARHNRWITWHFRSYQHNIWMTTNAPRRPNET